MMRSALLCLVLAALVTAPARADDALTPQRLDELEGRFQAVARECRPYSVAVLGLVGMGSGVVIDRSGLVLTNAHVAVAARWCAVVFPDGRRLLGRRLGIYFPRDLALIQLPEGDYPAAPLAPADSVESGDWVLAYGHPGGLKPDRLPTFSAGRVTGRASGVQVMGLLDYDGGVETDLSIYSGNSGGPLFDLQGRLVGINGAVNPALGESYSLSMDIIEDALPKLRDGKIHLGPDLSIDPAARELAAIFEAYDGFSKKVAENWIEAGWPGEHMPDGDEKKTDLEEWAGRLLDRIDSARQKIEESPIWRGSHGEERQQLLTASFAGAFESSAGRAVQIVGEDGDAICLGTIVSGGFVVTKASLVGDQDVAAVTPGGTKLELALDSTHLRHDLALFRASGATLPDGAADAPEIEVGSWVLVPGAARGGLAAGVLSAKARPIPATAETLVPEAIQRATIFALVRLLRSAPREMGLGALADQLESSDRRDRIFELHNVPRTYPHVLQHDAPLDVDQMGGPLLDGEGRLVGVNVGRAHHGTVYTVSIDTIRQEFAGALEGGR